MARLDKKPTGLQDRILRAMVEDSCTIRVTALQSALYDDRGYFVRTMTAYTFRSILKSGWIETDPDDVHRWRISARGRAAIVSETRGAA